MGEPRARDLANLAILGFDRFDQQRDESVGLLWRRCC
jgi:hypothetical protein